MKTPLHYFLLLGAFLLFSATNCKKDSSTTTTAEGAVIDKTTQKSIAGATARLIKVNSSFMGGSSLKVVSQMTVDATGKYSFTFTPDLDYSYQVGASANKYFTDEGDNHYIHTGKKNLILIPLQPEAYLKIHVKNASPYDGNDYIHINENGIETFYGMNVDTSVTLLENGNTVVTKYGIYCPAFDTTLYNINY